MYDRPPPAAERRADAVTNPVLRVRNLTTAFRRDDMWTEVIRNISFHIDPGETLAGRCWNCPKARCAASAATRSA